MEETREEKLTKLIVKSLDIHTEMLEVLEAQMESLQKRITTLESPLKENK